MTKLDIIKATATEVALGLLLTSEAEATLPGCKFEMMRNGKCYWRDYRSGLWGSEK